MAPNLRLSVVVPAPPLMVSAWLAEELVVSM